MKKLVKIFLIVLASIVALAAIAVALKVFVFKDPVTYTAVSGFYYSGDKGHTYGDGTKEYVVGESVYMKVKFRVASTERKTSQVKAVLTIPNVQNVDAKYMDGQVITPNYDAVNNVTTYEFIANASREAMETECVFQYIPNSAGSITITLIFDDNVDPSYDKQSTLVFVEP